MSLQEATAENLKFIIDDLAERLQVINRSILDPDHYDMDHYDEIKSLYDMVVSRGQISVSEIHAIIEELKKYRKK
ncbi:DUF1128 domain-containing protein [Salirhabdus salicampi]|uniref:DUF1128 domain-containing protein n=1 Tax=Salirhabdus salicampi TaxID=476102 RepID=UPI0020C49695|nr:DUF1128 domain-containing protein [Salirhabdus salicampi]